MTILNWTLIHNNKRTILGYGLTMSANGKYTISHSYPSSKTYVSVYGFSDYGRYGS